MTIPRICIIGTGNIAQTHAEALSRISGVKTSAVIDIDSNRAKGFASKWGIDSVYPDIATAVAENGFDVAHVTTPPDSHAQILLDLARCGKHALSEKPVTTSVRDAEELANIADEKKLTFGVNQNFVHHPTFQKLLGTVESQRFGKVKHVSCHYLMPLRQLDAQQFGHWMFQDPVNLLLEQAVHPLSQIAAITGTLSVNTARGERSQDLVEGVPFMSTIDILLDAPESSASLTIALGHSFPTWSVEVLCEDGIVKADMILNRVSVQTKGRRIEFIDNVLQSVREGMDICWQGLKGGLAYLAAILKILPRNDSFYQSMESSIREFYQSHSDRKSPRLDVSFGANLVNVCQSISGILNPEYSAKKKRSPDESPGNCDVIVLGGSGFIGVPTVRKLKKAGYKVALLARSVDHLLQKSEFKDVKILQGDVTNKDDVERAVLGVPNVINLAHGGGGDSWKSVQKSMVGSAMTVAEVCHNGGSKRLIHVGSIAGLYLGDQTETVYGATPPDPQPEKRAHYARAKAEADQLLLNFHKERQLPVCILRPGVVVGSGGPPFHSAIGFANTETHWFGWNHGRNDLPFVLVDDVADALVNALKAEKIEGQCFNLASDLGISARSYMAEVAKRLERPIQFYPNSIFRVWMEEVSKWVIKRTIGRNVAFPSIRDFKSRAMLSKLDCSDAKEKLSWHPEEDFDAFFDKLFSSSRENEN